MREPEFAEEPKVEREGDSQCGSLENSKEVGILFKPTLIPL